MTHVAIIPSRQTTIRMIRYGTSVAERDCRQAAAVVAHSRQGVAAVAEEIVVGRQRIVAGDTGSDTGPCQAMRQVAGKVEQEVTRPTGWRKIFRGGITLLANAAPTLTLLGSIILVLYLVFAQQETPSLVLLLMPVYLTLAVLILMQVIISIALPVKWAAIREEFKERLGKKLREEFGRVFLPIPDEIATAVKEERKQAETLAAETKQVAEWLSGETLHGTLWRAGLPKTFGSSTGRAASDRAVGVS